MENLDCKTEEELAKLQQNFIILATYCEAKRIAICHRKAGNIEKAMLYEQDCERIFYHMPEELKW
jgi:hypothetical protein